MPDSGQPTSTEIRNLTAEVARLNSHRFLKVYASVPRMLFFNFARGLVFGLGTVMGASVLLSGVIWSLSQIDFIPVIGDWAGDIVRQMEAERDKE
ncbi:MAG: DUF5665 domain-containing protein [Rhodobacteraceae bacterium]|nr:DUF5665 domain-containing protein [Paracoccaceae bacterium]